MRRYYVDNGKFMFGFFGSWIEAAIEANQMMMDNSCVKSIVITK